MESQCLKFYRMICALYYFNFLGSQTYIWSLRLTSYDTYFRRYGHLMENIKSHTRDRVDFAL